MTSEKSNIKFTIIIPTRERADTLQWSLKTCTTQDYENLEIIVSDNFSQDQTREVVEAYKDERIRYVNTGERVSMTSNYEFGLMHATGDYICIIGDDDGIMPNALQELNEILFDSEIEAISWNMPVYIWNQLYKTAFRNTLQISFKSNFPKSNSQEMVKELLAFNGDSSLTYRNLACLYHGFIKRDTINKLRLPDGRFFNSMIPDVYASLVISCAIENLYKTEVPYSLPGISRHSTGYSSEKSESLSKFLLETDIAPHPNIKISPISAPICTAECFLKVRDNFPKAGKFEINIKGMIKRAVEEAVSLSEDNYQSITDAVRYIAEVYGIQEYTDNTIAQNPNLPTRGSFIIGYNFLDKHLTIKCSQNVKNIYDATLVCKKIYEEKQPGFYILETNRFAVNTIKNYGIKGIINKGIRYISNKFGSAN